MNDVSGYSMPEYSFINCTRSMAAGFARNIHKYHIISYKNFI